jgi:hypothetical protein
MHIGRQQGGANGQQVHRPAFVVAAAARALPGVGLIAIEM